MQDSDQYWMQQAIALAKRAEERGEVPVGAVVIGEEGLLGEGWNQPIGSFDPTAHAEIMALRAAAMQRANYRLPNTTLYVTIEPCTMCVGAMVHARIKRLVFGALESKAGAVVSRGRLLEEDYMNHRITYDYGVEAEQCAELIRDFFRNKRVK